MAYWTYPVAVTYIHRIAPRQSFDVFWIKQARPRRYPFTCGLYEDDYGYAYEIEGLGSDIRRG